jgi:uncharacterized protein YhaN
MWKYECGEYMKITKLDIKGFGRFENRSFSPGSGLNVFYGLNESGKSTIQAFVKAMLFGIKSGRRSKDSVNQIRQFKPWFGKAFAGVLEYKLDDGRSFLVGRNFENNTLTVYDEYSNNITGEFPSDKEAVAKFAELHSGLSESVFERTAFISQMQSAVNNEGRKVLAERLINLKHSGDEQVSLKRAVNALKQAQITFVGSSRSTNRPINQLNIQLQDELSKERKAREQHDTSIYNYIELEKTQKKVEEQKQKLDELKKTRMILCQNAEAKMLNDKKQKLCGYMQQITEIAAKKGEIKNQEKHLTRELEVLKGYSEFNRKDADSMVEDNIRYQFLVDELDELQQKNDANFEKIIEVENDLEKFSVFQREGYRMQGVLDGFMQLEAEKKHMTDTNRKRNKEQKRILFICICVLISSFSALYIFRMHIPELLVRAFSVLLASFFIATVIVYARVLLKYRSRKRSDNDDAMQTLNDYRQLLMEWMDEADVESINDLTRLKSMYNDKVGFLEELQSKNDTYLKEKTVLENRINVLKADILQKLRKTDICLNSDSFSTDDISNWKRGLESYISCTPAINALKNELENIAQNEEIIYDQAGMVYGEDIKSWEQLEKAIKEVCERQSDKKPIFLGEEITLTQVDREIESIHKEINQGLIKVNTLATRLEDIPDGEMLQKAFERVQALQEEKEGMLFLSKAIETAISVLTEASVIIHRDYVPHLSRELSHYLNTVTGGLYDNALVDDNLALNILPNEHMERVLPEQLSSGTIDQVYLALRLAAVRLIEQESERIPLFFDEPFSQYDEDRTQNALRLLIEESRQRQIFLYTCKMREVEFIRELEKTGTINIIDL